MKLCLKRARVLDSERSQNLNLYTDRIIKSKVQATLPLKSILGADPISNESEVGWKKSGHPSQSSKYQLSSRDAVAADNLMAANSRPSPIEGDSIKSNFSTSAIS